MARSGFTLAKLRSPTISNYLSGWILDVVQEALAGESFWEEKGPPFAISVTSCLIAFWTILTQALGPLNSKFPSSHDAHATTRNSSVSFSRMWKLAIWAFSRIPITVTNESDQTEMSTFLDAHIWFYTQSWDTVTTLLNTGDLKRKEKVQQNDVQKALECASALVKQRWCLWDEGRVRYFMSGIGIPPSSHPRSEGTISSLYLPLRLVT